jgi:hypothetical protein
MSVHDMSDFVWWIYNSNWLEKDALSYKLQDKINACQVWAPINQCEPKHA